MKRKQRALQVIPFLPWQTLPRLFRPRRHRARRRHGRVPMAARVTRLATLPLSIWLHQNTCGRAFEPRKAQNPVRVLGFLPATPSPRISFS